MPDIAVEQLSITNGHDGCPPVNSNDGDSTLIINGRNVLTVGSMFNSHGSDDYGSHQGTVTTGSSVFFVNGKAVARVNDIVDAACPSSHHITTGDATVNIDN